MSLVSGVTITARPAKHGVHEVTFVLRAGSDAVYFAGDTLYIPELDQMPQPLGPINLALLPTNGLQIRPTDFEPAGPRPMITVLDAKPGRAGDLRRLVTEFAEQVRREAGC